MQQINGSIPGNLHRENKVQNITSTNIRPKITTFGDTWINIRQ